MRAAEGRATHTVLDLARIVFWQTSNLQAPRALAHHRTAVPIAVYRWMIVGQLGRVARE
jgi:hypothetical protein